MVELVESHDYGRQKQRIASARTLDETLVAPTFILAQNPGAYRVIYGSNDIRLLKTEAGFGIPPLSLWFRFNQGENKVYLLWIEKRPADN